MLFALALAAEPASLDGACALQRPGACSDTHDLADDPAFAAELKRFVGDRPTHFLDNNGRAYAETLAVLTGPTAPMQKVGDLYLFTGCRDKTCEEQGAALVTGSGQFVAVAVLHTDCARFAPAKDCFERDILSVIMPQGQEDQTVVDALTGWAKRQVDANVASAGAPATRLDRVEVVGAPRARPLVVAKAPKVVAPRAEAKVEPEASAEPAPPKPAEKPKSPLLAFVKPAPKPQAPKPAVVAAAKDESAAPEPQTPHSAITAIAKDALVQMAKADPAPTPPPAAASIIELPTAATPEKPKPKPKPKTWVWHWTPYGY